MSSISSTQINSSQTSSGIPETTATSGWSLSCLDRWAERGFVFLESGEILLIYKIGAVALPLILAFAACTLAGYSFSLSVGIVVITAALIYSIYVVGKANFRLSGIYNAELRNISLTPIGVSCFSYRPA